MPASHLLKLIERRDLWTVGVFRVASTEDLFKASAHSLVKLVGETGLRVSRDYQAVAADPFLFVQGDRLYLFYEVKTDHGHGEIHAQSMTRDGRWQTHGAVLTESFHLSYPQVFALEGRIYMIPEAAQSGKVWLYEAKEFPFNWQRRAVLIDQPLRDPTLVISRDDGLFLLATTAQYELKLHHAADLSGPFSELGISITTDKRVARCAGGILMLDDQMLRPAQDCLETYGKLIRFQSIECLTPSVYREQPFDSKLQIASQAWMSRGCHHISATQFADSLYVAIDGRGADWWINSLTLGLLRLLDKTRGR